MTAPKFDEMFNPLIQALKELGGSASIQEQEEKVAEIMNLSEKDLSEMHTDDRTKYSYNLAWTRTYLKHYNILENSKRGVWALTPNAYQMGKVDKNEVKKANK